MADRERKSRIERLESRVAEAVVKVVNDNAVPYLGPWRYFRMYRSENLKTGQTLWIPEGWDN